MQVKESQAAVAWESAVPALLTSLHHLLNQVLWIGVLLGESVEAKLVPGVLHTQSVASECQRHRTFSSAQLRCFLCLHCCWPLQPVLLSVFGAYICLASWLL